MNKFFTIPNLLTVFRIILIPFFVILYFNKRVENNYWYATGILVLSGFTDILDGIIARNFNMISNFGKVLDPIADKLSQASVLFCLCFDHPIIIPMMIALVVKELFMLIGAAIMYKHGLRPFPAKWWGKLSTVIIFCTIFVFLLSNIFAFIPQLLSYTLACLSVLSMIFSLVNYILAFLNIKKQGELTIKN
ncbi:MAG TPA: CDP-alcohol phosphatidyltransferase family protein [Clostridiales bacterium]|nr:CDP-alcohol phosphatidyltransferase family protein [Clostridiales bacterium]